MASLWLVVGGSRGFGEVLWKSIRECESNHVLVYSRSGNAGTSADGRVEHFNLDIGNLDNLPQQFTASLEKVFHLFKKLWGFSCHI